MTVTIRDVAQAAGVSIATVSRALSSAEQVAPRTRDLVHRVAKELGYRRSNAGRPGRSISTGCIGLVIPDIENPHFSSVSNGVQERAQAAGYTVLIANSDEDPVQEVQSVRTLAGKVDGVILASPRAEGEMLAELAQSVPMVLLNREIPGVTSFNFDHAGGMRSVLQHLVALGHRQIAYAGGPAQAWSEGQRLAAFRAFDEGIELVELGNFAPGFTSGLQVADLVIASGSTAVIAYNDLMAIGVIDRLHQRGVRVPEQLSVAGFDNIPAATMVWPNLTSIEYPPTMIGRSVIAALLERVSDPAGAAIAAKETEIPVQLVVRASTGVSPDSEHKRAAPARRLADAPPS